HIGLQEREVEHKNIDMNKAEGYSHFFILKDTQGNIKKNTPYIVKVGDKTIKGISNDLGETEIIYLEDEKDLDISINTEDYDINRFTSGD
ncbi:hypothetical protein, partial [Rodentibacter ratti]